MVGSVFLLVLADAYRTASRQVKEDTMSSSKVVLAHTVDKIEKFLREIELIAENRIWQLSALMDSPDVALDNVRQVVRSYSFFTGCALAFNPAYFKESVYSSPYAYRKHGQVCTRQLNADEYRYTEKEWFRNPVTAEEGKWSQPYYDKNGGEQRVLTYSRPLLDLEGICYAVLTVDVSMSLLEEQIQQMNRSMQSFSLIIDSLGDYVVQPRHVQFKEGNIFLSAENLENIQVKDLAERMTKGKFGQIEVDSQWGNYYVFYQPIEKMNWAVAVCYHESVLFRKVHAITRQFLFEMILGLILIAVVIYLVIHKMTAPLKKLTDSAVKIAGGEFAVKLPHLHSQDEMAVLCRSFDFMQRSLVEYMNQLKRNVAEQERLESDLRIAGDIQQKMLPTNFPVYPNNRKLDVFAKVVPAKVVGGDFYQFLNRDDTFYFILGDVSGKGVSGALIMSALCRLFRFVAPTSKSSSEIVTTLNTALLDENDTNMFATVFVGVLHLSTGVLDYCNAGHNAAIVLPLSGRARWLPTEPNLPLGLFDDVDFEEQKMTMMPGEAILLYTDGVTEAENPQKELYSEERLLEVAENLAPLTSKAVVERLYDQIVLYAAGAEQNDDITMLCVNYSPDKKEIYETDIVVKK